MFNINEFKTSTTWDLENKIFYDYCDWCFANELDNRANDCDKCQNIFWKEIKRRKKEVYK